MITDRDDPRYHRSAPSRRTVLRGLGATLALPWLPSLAWAGGGDGEPAVLDGPPRRYVALVFGNGIVPADWWARGSGEAMELGPTLEPLAAHKRDVLVLDNLSIFDDTTGFHVEYFANLLSAGRIDRNNPIPSAGLSVDQFMARAIGDRTHLPCLTLGIEPMTGAMLGPVSDALRRTISWRSETTPVPPEVDPRMAFDALFDTSAMVRDRSVLDAVLAQTRDLAPRLAVADRHKLDEFQSAVRAVEARIQRATEEQVERGGWRPSLDEPDMPRPPASAPAAYAEHVDLMLDILVLALRMDRTRIASFLFQGDVSDMTFEWLEGVERKALHNGLSHHQNVAAVVRQHQITNRWHVAQFAGLLDKMAAVDEGGSTLLDNSMLTFTTSMIDGNTHDAKRIPVLVAGRGGGSIAPGRVIDYQKLADRRICNLHLAMAQRMGMAVDRFGNSNHPLPGLEG